jgi:hypothetical protein
MILTIRSDQFKGGGSALFRDTRNSQKISRPRRKRRSPFHTTLDITTAYLPTEEDIVAAIETHNRLRGEPAELTVVPDTGRNRRRFFKTANKIEREAEEAQARSALLEKEELERTEKEWNQKNALLRVSRSNEAKAWRKANGVSEDEAIKAAKEYERGLETTDRNERVYNVGLLLAAAEKFFEKKTRIDIDLQDIILTLIKHVPDLENHVPAELIEAIKGVGRKKPYEAPLSLYGKRTLFARESITELQSNSHYGGFPCREAYEDYKDAAIGQGEWCEEDLDEEGDDQDEVGMYWGDVG